MYGTRMSSLSAVMAMSNMMAFSISSEYPAHGYRRVRHIGSRDPAPLADYLMGVPTRQVRRWEARKGHRA